MEALACDLCGNPIEACMCVCPYCGERDACECCLYDAATGGVDKLRCLGESRLGSNYSLFVCNPHILKQ